MFWVIDKERLEDASSKFVQNNEGQLFLSDTRGLTNIDYFNKFIGKTKYVGITTDLCYTDLHNKLSSNNIPFGSGTGLDDPEIYIPCLNTTFVFSDNGGYFNYTY